MEKQSLVRGKFHTLLILSFLIIQFQYCKLDLNNPKDPMSKSFMETFLWESYLNSLCTPNLRGEVKLGSGSGQVYAYDLLKLKNGNLVVLGATNEALVWSGGSGVGKNYSFTIGPQFFVFLVNGKTFQIEWLDYLGVLGSGFNSNVSHIPHLAEFANGDFVVKTYVYSTQNTPIPISEKFNEDSMFFVRFDQKGNRIWQTYLDKGNESLDNSFSPIVVDQNDNIHYFFATTSTYYESIGFSEFPPAEQASAGGSVIETGWALISGNGYPIRQKYLTGEYGTTIAIRSAVLGPHRNIVLAGTATGNLVGLSGHPYPNYSLFRPITINLSVDNFGISNVSYLGSNNSAISNALMSSLIAGEDGFFGGGHYYENYGNPVLPAVSNDFRNFIFFKTDWSGNPLWYTFVSTLDDGVSDVYPSVSYLGDNQFRAKLLGMESDVRYTSLNNIESGPGTGANQSLTVRLDQTGKFTKAYYETNATETGFSAGIEARACEVCQGRLVRLDTVVTLPSSTRYLQLSTRPAKEEP
ncbi:hypothetical protein EHQ30_03550 [Leptospira brenneri]|uniref:Uncharacterized protein n=1 Tax=Leptospira brenneri TaxID=2023182 RepID=A0A5F1ZA77_9LEPT|nr:hypothetical protein [Leptospira brenneri]TGK95723.1 hypothetical protein EHQ30_03550 [Leptospira brenneri]